MGSNEKANDEIKSTFILKDSIQTIPSRPVHSGRGTSLPQSYRHQGLLGPGKPAHSKAIRDDRVHDQVNEGDDE